MTAATIAGGRRYGLNIKNQPDSGAVFARWLKRISPGNVHRAGRYGV
ncbi:hypothetical protein QYK_1271, partial [Escherichia coli B28-1]